MEIRSRPETVLFLCPNSGGDRNKNQKEYKPKNKGKIPVPDLPGQRPDYSGSVPVQI